MRNIPDLGKSENIHTEMKFEAQSYQPNMVELLYWLAC